MKIMITFLLAVAALMAAPAAANASTHHAVHVTCSRTWQGNFNQNASPPWSEFKWTQPTSVCNLIGQERSTCAVHGNTFSALSGDVSSEGIEDRATCPPGSALVACAIHSKVPGGLWGNWFTWCRL